MGKGALNGQNAKSQTLKDLGPEKKSSFGFNHVQI
jgi:hypothetical protein